MRRWIQIIFILCGLNALAVGTTLFDFESGDLTGWRIVSGEFGAIVTDRAVTHGRGKPFSKQGNWFLSTLDTLEGGANDRFTGVLESEPFILKSETIQFRVGGGRRGVYVALCALDGTELMRAAGKNTDTMKPVSWNVPKLVGQAVYLSVVDQATGGWGHITVDAFEADVTWSPESDALRTRLRRLKPIQSVAAMIQPLTRAIDDLTTSFPSRYPHTFREELEEFMSLESLLERAESGDDVALEEAESWVPRFRAFRASALLANPLLTDTSLVYTVRRQYKADHHNTATLFQHGEINEHSYDPPGLMKVLEPSTGDVKVLVDAGAKGIARDPEVSPDGSKIIFSMRKSKTDDYHIYEVDAAGNGLKQLTSLTGVSDIDPVYLPDGKIIFSSTREPKFCMCNRHIMANLYRMDGDGANIHQIGKSTLFEGHSTVMDDGRILYDRWEYTDRNFGDAQGLWMTNPDGTMHSIYYGNNTPSPGGVIDARQIPGSTQVICVFGSCHDRPWGALAILDRNKGVDGAEPVEHIWPASARKRIGKGNWDAFKPVRPRYEDPYPLADPATLAGSGTYFLCARTVEGQDERTGIYLIDRFGNEVLVHEETDGFSCFDPMPLAASRSAKSRPDHRDFENKNGTVYVQDVYEGTHMAGVQRGEVKSLRVVTTPEKRSFSLGSQWQGQGAQFPAMNWHSFESKRILGTVPVESDGSAYFELPSDTHLYFQLLDAEGKMIQSMRSGTILQSGEMQGCVGCHENRVGAPPASAIGLLALQRPPSPMGQGLGAGELFSYLQDVQPVFDQHCVRCHDFGKKAGEKLLLAADKELVFNASYVDLWRKKFITVAGGGQAETYPAKSWGSYASKLTETLEGHRRVSLTSEEKMRVYTWMDLNGIYYPTYDCAFAYNPTGRSPLSTEELARLSKLCGMNPKHLTSRHFQPGVMISFDRPECSPCLESLEADSAAYDEALALIERGTEVLKTTPRADMPNFIAHSDGLKRTERYETLRRKEEAFRSALREGRKVYDEDVQTLK